MRKLKLEELNRMSAEAYKLSEKHQVWVILDNVRSQHNIGSVFRTVDAFRLEGICLCGITAVPPNKEIHKTALGSENSVDYLYFEKPLEAARYLKEKGYHIVAVEQAEGSCPLQEFQPGALVKIALVFGNEINGVSQEIMDVAETAIEITQFGSKHSINISVCAGIVIWEIIRKMGMRQSI